VTILTVHPAMPLTQIVIVYNLPKVNGACISCHLKLMIVLTNRKTTPPPSPIRNNPGSQSIFPSSTSFSYIVFRGFILELMMYLTLKSPSCNTTVDITRTETSTVFCNSLTLWRLMSYIYMEHPFLMFLDHTQRRSTVGRTPLDE